jgi:hypothetical protein
MEALRRQALSVAHQKVSWMVCGWMTHLGGHWLDEMPGTHSFPTLSSCIAVGGVLIDRGTPLLQRLRPWLWFFQSKGRSNPLLL